MAPIATNGQAGNKKFFLFAVVLVLATFLHSSDEFAFKFGGDDESDTVVTDTGNKKIKRPSVKKFKFHKIERIYDDEEVENEGVDDDNDDDEDDNGKHNTKETKIKNTDSEEGGEIPFERVRRAKKPLRDEEKKTASGEDQTFLDQIFSIFSWGKQKEEKVEKAEPSSNGIIDWIMWLGEKTGRLTSEPSPPSPPVSTESDVENWISYLNRWPFNALFPIGKSEKSINLPRKMKSGRFKSTHDTSDMEENNEEPMSQAHFEYLLHSLPGFVINATRLSADLECRQQMQVFHRQLRAKKLWTLQMLDATGKITSGLLRGNINQFGDFDLCIQVKAAVKVTPETPMRIRGKYCLAHIEMGTDIPELKVAIHLAQGRGLVNSHLDNPSHFLGRYSIANWGVCIPNACPSSVIQEMLDMNLSPYNRTGIEFHVEIKDNDCSVRPVKYITKLFKKDQQFASSVFLMFTLVILVLSALIADFKSQLKSLLQLIPNFQRTKTEDNEVEEENTVKDSKEEDKSVSDTEKETEIADTIDNEKSNENSAEEKTIPEELNVSVTSGIRQLLYDVFMSFSPKRTFLELFSQERLDLEFPIFHLMKLISTLMLYVCLKFMMIGHLPITNRDKLVRFLDQPLSVFFRMPIFYSDILLLISGFMIAYQLSEEMIEKRYIQLLKRLTIKIARYLPTMFIVLTFQTWILPHLGTGPLWSNLIGQHAELCEQQMWRNGFSVQNAIHFEDTCSPFTIQIALQIQLYLLGPLIVWLYYTDADAVFYVYGALHAFSVGARYSRTNLEHLSMTLFHGINVSKFYRSANLLFASPITRATPYLLGIGTALLYRTQNGSLQIDNLLPLGWILSIFSLLWCFWSPSVGMNTEYVYNANDAASYAAWSPLVSSLALCWLIFMFPKNKNSMFRILCSTRPVLFLSRIAYPMQLVTYVVVLHNTASVRETMKFHITDLFNFNEIGAILFYATVLAFILDVPTQQVRYLLLNRLFMERPPLEESEAEESVLETQPNEQEKLDGQIEPAKDDTVKQEDSIWSSDPEEEERNYIERRRSSLLETAVEEIVNKTNGNQSERSKEVDKKEEEVEDEEEEEEEENDIEEEEEVKKRP